MKRNNSAHLLAVDSIYEALVQLMEKKTYQEISITDITNRAGVSRMAYYRNYKDKDSILLNRLQKKLENESDFISLKKNNANDDVWIDRLQAIQKDPVMKHIIHAGLIEQSFELHLAFIMKLYKQAYSVDTLDQDTLLLIYQRLGSLFGIMFYVMKENAHPDAKLLIRHLQSIPLYTTKKSTHK